MESRRIGIGDISCTVELDGPETHHAVLLLPDVGEPPSTYAEICSRLHNSGLRTIVLDSVAGMDEQAVRALMDELGLPMANLFGHGAGADLAWLLAARGFDRFVSLVVVGRGHPAAPDVDGVTAAPQCPPVELATTVLVGQDQKQRRWAQLSGRYVYGEFRVVPMDGVADVVHEAEREIATEIVLRTSLW